VVAFLALATLSQTATGEGDFFILVRQFGPTFCDDQNCSVEPFSAVTLHGLWPNYDDGSYPSYCDDSNKFSTKNLEKSTLNAMDCEWLSLTNSNQGFWSHEWSKHGTCALDLLPTQEDYFQKALELNGIYDVNVRCCCC
jgi:ribonuclease T2